MSISPLDQKLANLLRAINDEEVRIENARQELADNDKFEPSTAFNGIIAKGSDHLTVPQILELIKNSSINATRKDVEDVLRFYGIKSGAQISYYDFLNIVIPKNNAMLRRVCVERLPYYKDENFELSFDIRYGVVKIFEKSIEALRKIEAYKLELYQVAGSNLTDAFNALCQGKSNTIEYFSLYTFFKKIQVSVTDKEINNIVKHMDRDKDGEVTYSEFLDSVTPNKSTSEIERASIATSPLPDLVTLHRVRPSYIPEPIKSIPEPRYTTDSVKPTNPTPVDQKSTPAHQSNQLSFRPSYRVDPIPSFRPSHADKSNNPSNRPSHTTNTINPVSIEKIQINRINTIESNLVDSGLTRLNDPLPSTPTRRSQRNAYTSSKYFHASYEKLKKYERLTSPPVKPPRKSSSKSPKSRRSPRLHDSEVPRESPLRKSRETSPLRKSREPSPSTRRIEFDPVDVNVYTSKDTTSAVRLSPDRNETGVKTPLQRPSYDRPSIVRSSPQRRSPSRLSGRQESPLREAYLEDKGPVVKIQDQSAGKADISHNLSGYKLSDRLSYKSNEKFERFSTKDYKTPEAFSESPLRQSREKFLSTAVTTSNFSPSKYPKDHELFLVLKRQVELIREAEHEKNRLALRGDFDIHEAYRLFEHDEAGHINRGDLKAGLEKLNVIMSKKELYVLTKLLDRDADDAIKFGYFREFFTPSERRSSPSRASYKSGTRESQAMRPETIELTCRTIKNLIAIEIGFQELCKRITSGSDAFEQLDKKQHGYVTLHDLEDLFRDQNISISSKEALTLLEKYDKDLDARISYSDFIQTLATRAPEY